MENEKSPKDTGISSITGRIVKIRHATEADMGFIVENLKKYHLDTEDFNYSQFVVAMENGNPIGFARIKKTEEMYEIGCKKGSEELIDSLDKACRIGGKHNTVLMVYEKNR